MKKVKLNVMETLRYQREVIVLIPDDMTEKQLNKVLDEAQGSDCYSITDFVLNLEKAGFTTPERIDDSTDSPYDSEIECDDYEFVEADQADEKE